MAVKPRRVGPFRAVLAAHFATTQNRLVRDAGRFGAVGIGVLIAFLMVTLVLPFWGLLGVVGFYLGRGIHKALFELLLGGMLGLVALFGGIVGGSLGGAKQLAWEGYRSYPLRMRTLFAAELFAGIADFLPLATSLGMLSLLVGVAVGRPFTLPLLPVLFVEGVVSVLVIQLLVSSLAEAVVRRLRLALVLLASAFCAGAVLIQHIPQAAKNANPLAVDPSTLAGQLVLLGRGLQRASVYLPSSSAGRSLRHWVTGHYGLALADHIYPLLTLAAMSYFAARLLARESGRGSEDFDPPEPLWTFRSKTAGIARLQWNAVTRSQLGRFGFIIPLVTIALLKGPLGFVVGAGPWVVPTAFTYLSLASNNLQLNQFGLDGHGIKSILLVPIEPREVLRGKSIGLGLYQALQALLMTLLLFLLHRPPVLHLLGGLLLAGCFFFAQNAVGQFTSSWMPRAVPHASMRSHGTPLPLVLLGLGLSVGCATIYGGAYSLCLFRAPHLLLPVMATLFAASAVAHTLMLPAAARYFDAQRGHLVESLG